MSQPLVTAVFLAGRTAGVKTQGRGRTALLVGVENQKAGSDWIFFSNAELWVSFQHGYGQVRCKRG